MPDGWHPLNGIYASTGKFPLADFLFHNVWKTVGTFIIVCSTELRLAKLAHHLTCLSISGDIARAFEMKAVVGEAFMILQRRSYCALLDNMSDRLSGFVQ